jgi:branched-chain amino acid transport system substrate-binding protein
VVERYNALLFYPTLYEGFEYSRNIIYTGAAPNQNSLPLADFMLKNYGSRVCMIGSDYVYPYESNRIMSDLILERGGEKAYEHYLPLDAPAAWYGMTMEKVKDLAPDFIFSTVVGAATQHLYRAFAECGLDPQKTPIASLTTSETEIRQMGADCAAGHITAATYFQSIESDANQRCMTKHRRMFGDNQVTNMCWEAAYFQVHLLAMALRQTASMKVDEVLQVLPGLEFAAPQGIVRIDAQNHHTHLNPRIGRVNGEGQFEILAAESRSVRPDPYVVSHTLDDWALRMKDGK